MQKEPLTLEDLKGVWFRAKPVSGNDWNVNAEEPTNEQFHTWISGRIQIDLSNAPYVIDALGDKDIRLVLCNLLWSRGSLYIYRGE